MDAELKLHEFNLALWATASSTCLCNIQLQLLMSPELQFDLPDILSQL
jgi:hypothetical protein